MIPASTRASGDTVSDTAIPREQRLVLKMAAARLAEEFEGMATDGLPVVLFLCVHNAGRSQIALGWFNHLAGDRAKPAKTARRTEWVHALIATEAYCLVVRDIFDRRSDVAYKHTSRDHKRLEAFPRQVGALTQRRIDASDHGATPLWHGADQAAAWAAISQRVIARLQQPDEEDEEDDDAGCV